jgi:hypothetical protein
MNKICAFLAIALLPSCAGMKVLKEPPPQEKSQQGVTLGGNPISGGLTVQKVGFWCEAKKGLLSIGAFGPTEAESKANAQKKCRDMFKDSPCEIASCKPSE